MRIRLGGRVKVSLCEHYSDIALSTQVKIIYTGGTFGMLPGDLGLAPASKLSNRIRRALKERPTLNTKLLDIDWAISERKPLLDSANMLPADWESIAKSCSDTKDARAIIVIHGTDTLAYTACALAYFLAKIKIPVILTGSQRPLEAKDSDALDNLSGALLAANNVDAGVWVYFHHQLMPAARVVKKDALSDDGFATPKLRTPFQAGEPKLAWQNTPRPWSTLIIPIIHLSPGFQAEQLNALIANKPSAIVLVLYGQGTFNNENTALISALKKAHQKDIVLVAVSQVYIGQIDFSLYAAGAELDDIGVISGQDMTLEAAYTKLMVLFRLGYTVKLIKQLFGQSIAGEIRSTHE